MSISGDTGPKLARRSRHNGEKYTGSLWVFKLQENVGTKRRKQKRLVIVKCRLLLLKQETHEELRENNKVCDLTCL